MLGLNFRLFLRFLRFSKQYRQYRDTFTSYSGFLQLGYLIYEKIIRRQIHTHLNRFYSRPNEFLFSFSCHKKLREKNYSFILLSLSVCSMNKSKANLLFEDIRRIFCFPIYICGDINVILLSVKLQEISEYSRSIEGLTISQIMNS